MQNSTYCGASKPRNETEYGQYREKSFIFQNTEKMCQTIKKNQKKMLFEYGMIQRARAATKGATMK